MVWFYYRLGLVERGYSLDLQKRYKKSNWLQSVGVGAVIRTGDNVDYHGGLYALQTQAKLSVHVGGRTALLLQGKGHYLEMDQTRVVLFGESREKLPSWFLHHNWGLGQHLIISQHPFYQRNVGLLI